MAAAVAPVELPTGRRSYYNTSTPVDIHDPNWIPVLDSAAYKPPLSPTEKEVSTYSQPPASFSLFPSQASSPKPRPAISHSYSKSSLAPESLASDSDSRSQSPQDSIEPLPSIGGPVQASQDGTRGHNRQTTSTTAASSEEKISVNTESPGDGVGSSPNSEEHETASVMEERELSQPGRPPEPMGEPLVNPSTRSSMISAMTKKTSVLPPTSKYNRKHVASVATTAGLPLVPSLPQTPRESPRLAPTVPTTTPVAQPLPSPKLPASEGPRQTEPSQKLQPTKSTASERRQRALHSHPSNVSLRSQRNSSSDDAEIIPRPPSVRNKSRKSTDSRATTPRSTIYDSQVPTPAPTTPLPQLPPGAQIRRPSTREGNSQKTLQAPIEEPVPSAASPFRPFEHAEMASFMTEKNTIICRRFDAVHVRLLLCLQDEISQLEKELLKLESSNSPGTASEKMMQKTRILRELRKVVAEYDHLFTTWSKMQASKVSDSTTKELKEWLAKPGTSIEAGLGINTQQDLQWLENTKDLSSIQLGDNEAEPAVDKEKGSQGAEEGGGGGGGGGGGSSGGGGGFMALFGCGGKRK
ncbi:uncharacterized protein Z520_06258 [Fonsecaea multimorphosa CBS 102226]|uniref:DUF6594 domain-containing protein n=1 Tax=Fonsecaea multimorphosa CBS 102226 TaxID=1442371 RepID=A0A0D2KN74_9EURO|nr:uncharacterized protein Z520_06258 [Fonsecaea multimorphosa CBS 102226]KIX98178.1 hypothetical protein Z520_06258 [Fonsecaea multimorphosa CBS 102226]OAL24253.1 hypothetical protein AYO22_05913 [Fonsecaea multimorphosa]